MTILEEARWYMTHVEHFERTAGGEYRMKYDTLNGRKDGEFKRWEGRYGKLIDHLIYKDGILDGLQRTYFKNGRPWHQFTTKNHKTIGEFKQWFNNGVLRLHSYFDENGVEFGIHTQWHRNGQLSLKYAVKEGKRDGEYLSWDKHGNIEERRIYENGIQLTIEAA